MNVRCVAFLFQSLFLRLKTIGAIRPHIFAVIARIKHIVELLTVMDAGVRDFVFANELVFAINIRVVFVAVMGHVVFLRPSRIDILVRFLLAGPVLWRFAVLDRRRP